MPQIKIYKGFDGDSWFLCRNELGHVYVMHEPNEVSGGKGSAVGIGDFLSHKNTGPEHQALLQLIGALVEAPQR